MLFCGREFFSLRRGGRKRWGGGRVEDMVDDDLVLKGSECVLEFAVDFDRV